MHRVWFIGVLLCLAAGCGDSDPVTVLTVQSLAEPESTTYRLLETLADEFSEQDGNSDVRIRLVGSRRRLEYLFRGVVAQTAADVIEVRAGEIGILRGRGALARLPRLRAAVEACHERATVAAAGPEGVYAVPWSARPKLLVFNREMTAGLDPPGTWAETVRQATSLTRDTDGDGRADVFGFALAAKESTDFGRHYATFLSQIGVPVMESADGRWRFNIEPREGAQAMAFILGLREASPPECIVSDDADALRQFRAGRSAMVIAGPESLIGPPGGAELKIGVADLPLPADGVPRCDVEFRHFVVPGYVRGRRKDAAARFLQFVAGRRGQELVAAGLDEERPVVAVRTDVLGGERYRSDPRLAAFARAVGRGAPVLPAYIWEGRCSKDWIGTLHRILLRDDPSPRLIRELVFLSQERGNEALSCRHTEIGHPSATTALGMSLLGVLVFVAVAYAVARH